MGSCRSRVGTPGEAGEATGQNPGRLRIFSLTAGQAIRKRSIAGWRCLKKSLPRSAADTPSNRGTQLQVRLFRAGRSPIQKGDRKPHLPLENRTYPQGPAGRYGKLSPGLP